MKNILVIGSLNMDLVINTDRIPVPGETLHGSGFSHFPGGKGANQASACARAGGNVKMLGKVGNDAYGDILLKNLSQDGVNISGVEREDISTGVAVITVCKGENTIILDKGANGMVDKDYIDRHIDAIDWADYVIMQYEIPMETIVYIAQLAKSKGKAIVIDPAPMLDAPRELYEMADIILPNETETAHLIGETLEPEDAVKKMHQLGAKNVIMTLGKKGSLFYDGEKIINQPAYKVKAIDSTGAGDCFTGSLVAHLATEKTMEEALEFATKASAIAVGRRGAQPSFPWKSEVEKWKKGKK
ncbi:MAG: ribokinase [Clostridia bacterium]|nr:ribokinase [Clostridia bacterium]